MPSKPALRGTFKSASPSVTSGSELDHKSQGRGEGSTSLLVKQFGGRKQVFLSQNLSSLFTILLVMTPAQMPQ